MKITIILYRDGREEHRFPAWDEQDYEFVFYDDMVYEYSGSQNDSRLYNLRGTCLAAP